MASWVSALLSALNDVMKMLFIGGRGPARYGGDIGEVMKMLFIGGQGYA